MSTRIGNDPGAGFIPPRWLDEREAAAWRGFLDMRAVLMARLGRELQRRDGLSESDYGVLVELSEAAEPRLRPGELAARLGWEKSRLSRQVARMQRRGLVRRDDCPADGRGAFVVLARAGREAVERAARAMSATSAAGSSKPLPRTSSTRWPRFPPRSCAGCARTRPRKVRPRAERAVD